jgi:hypothetical protein
MTDVEAAKLVTMLITAWPDGMRWLDPGQQAETRALYRQFLMDLDYAAGDAAVRRLIATWRPTNAQRMPTIAELRAAIATQRDGRAMAGGEAWGAVRRLRGGDQASYEALDPTARAVLEGLGWVVWDDLFRGGEVVKRWRVVIGQSVDDAVADRARFIELWDQLVSRGGTDRAVGLMAPPVPQRQLEGDGPKTFAEIAKGLLPDGESR